MRPHLWISAAILACLAPAPAPAGDILGVGDPAPPLAVGKWIKGEKVEEFEPGKTYVVEFWATWCSPSLACIPHTTELARKYKDVRFIGVDVWEEDTRKVAPFVAKMGEDMGYSVALDDTSAAVNAWQGMMALTWLGAAREFVLPTAFIIHDGKIAWITNPMAMDEPLARIVAGEWDLAGLVRAREEEEAARQRLADRQGRIYALYRAGDYRGALAAIAELEAEHPELAEPFASVRFTAFCKAGDADKALPLGEALLEQHKDEGMTLNNIFFYVVDLSLKDEPDPRVSRLALRALRLADKQAGGNDMAIADSLAVALFRTGDAAAAVVAEEKALKILKAESPDRSHPYFKLFEDQLARFRKAAEKPGAP